MSEDRDRSVAVSTVRDRVAERDDVDENVLSAIEDRAEEGRVTPETMADWHRECREERESTAGALDAMESELQSYVSDLDPAERERNQVQARVEEFESEFDDLGRALDAVAARLSDTPREPTDPAAVYDAAAALRRCSRSTHDVAHALHHLEQALDEFATWLDDPETRIEELGDEISGSERYLENTETLLEQVESGQSPEPFDAWLAAYHLQQVMGAVFAELRTDVSELASWLDDRDGDYGDDVAALRDRLDDLETRYEACSRRLDETTDAIDDFESKRAAVADSLDEFEATIADLEPPVDWAAVEELVQAQFDEHAIDVR
ncbi:hypothetical protein [Haloplanus sp. C73]|uniref:hypothetical protein n=1 Tax=Haloplanus sp. C73 TaxID=3421641 RepID=UPI003EBDA398